MATLGNEPKTFGDIQQRLEEVLLQVRSKEVSLEKSLDLYEEAIRLCNTALDHISDPEFSDAERAQYLSEKAKQEAADGDSSEGLSEQGSPLEDRSAETPVPAPQAGSGDVVSEDSGE